MTSPPTRHVPAHWVAPNEVTRQPKCWVFLDTEAVIDGDDKSQRQSWRCAVTAHDHRDGAWPGWRSTDWVNHDTPDALWDYIDAKAGAGTRLVVVAHNLAYDLRISNAFVGLLERGWTLDRIRLDAQQTQVRWRQGRRTILMVDSMSWWPVGLGVLADEMGLTKPALPADANDDQTWLARCRADVEILRSAFMRMLDWLHDADLGVWQPTGAGQSWSTWRHKFMDHRVLVGDDPDIRAMEREAVFCGRAEAWQHGKARGGPFTEWDFESAYLRVMRDCEVPVRVVGHRVDPRPRDVARWRDVAMVCARAEVSTDVPVVPVTTPKGIVWPVGTFVTTLWQPELDLLDHVGASYRVLDCAVYHTAPALRTYAEWLWPLVNGDQANVDPIVHRTAKHWSRAFIGRFGVRYSTWENYGDTINGEVGLSTLHDLGAGTSFRLLHAGGRLLAEGAVIEGENAVPSIMGFVMSECRRRLWMTMERAGFENVLHIDTDGLLVNAAGSQLLTERGHAGVRVKGQYRSVEVIGPRQVVYGGQIRAPGVPRTSRRTGDRTWSGPAWQGLTASLRAGSLDSVTVSQRSLTLRGVDSRREHLADGGTAPFVVPAAPSESVASMDRSPAG